MSWYDAFIPPEIKSGKAIYTKGIKQGDWEGAGEDVLTAQSGHLGSYLRQADEGNEEIRQGFQDAIKNLGQLGDQQRDFQMQGLDKALGFYQPFEQRLNSIYGPPGSFRK